MGEQALAQSLHGTEGRVDVQALARSLDGTEVGSGSRCWQRGKMRAKRAVLEVESGRVTLAVHVGFSEKLKIDIYMTQLSCS